MVDWTVRCTVTPVMIVLGVLYDHDADLGELDAVAGELYGEETGEFACWGKDQVWRVVEALKRMGLINEHDGRLHLVKSRLHPVTREIAESSAVLLGELGLTPIKH